MFVIFDLDMTLVNSKVGENFRKQREWAEVYRLIPSFSLYAGIDQVINFLRENNIGYGIVTSSPKPYCDKVINYFGLEPEFSICFHDTTSRKPSPEPINLALSKIEKGKKVYSLGDRDIDIYASKAAKVVSIGCLWGSEDPMSLKNSLPDHLLSTPIELINLLSSN